ncbi:MAG: PAS domain S-box protein, partial [Methanoregula sp.]|nr:PAS domain S-box protein [Methanoregula sp.]
TSLALIKKTLEGERWESVKIPLFAADGMIHTVLWNSANILTADAELVSTIAQGVDITQNERAEEAMTESENRYRSVVEDQTEFICRFTPDGTLTFVNDAYCRYFDLKPEERIGKRHSVVLPPDDASLMKKHIQSLTLENFVGFIEHRIIIPSGEVRWHRWSDRAIFDNDGHVVEYQSVGRDITERKNREREIENLKKQTEFILGATRTGLDIIDSQFNLRYIDPAWQKIYGNPVGRKCHKYFMDRDTPCAGCGISEALETKSIWVTEERLPKEGNRPIQVTTIPFQADDGEWLVAEVNVDITERKKAEETIQHALAEKEVLLREIHHRVKNHLAGIISLIDLQIGSLTDPVMISQFNDLATRIRSMALIHESLSITKDLARINVASYTENLTRNLFQMYGKATNIRCRIEMGDIVIPIETATPCGLVMSEIVTNSLKYAFPDTFSCKEIRGEPCTIALTLHREGNDYLLRIADNGIGIPEGIDVTMSGSLGLYLIRFIVQHQLRGSREISTMNGTRYMIRFPEPAARERNTDE